MQDLEMDFSTYCYSQNSSASEVSSPVTPTSSSAGHLRYSSSTSSIESAFHNSANDSPSSPIFVGPKTGKRSLPDVQEEPHEREDDLVMFEDANELYDCLCKFPFGGLTGSVFSTNTANSWKSMTSNACIVTRRWRKALRSSQGTKTLIMTSQLDFPVTWNMQARVARNEGKTHRLRALRIASEPDSRPFQENGDRGKGEALRLSP